ncbi:MAG: phosphoribosylformylglycinamidine cyclo-ligase [Gemmatimonadetes bacterium]|nr:phosphoribosylformylglycinamidine cyclo-ligase [Gemmatimonadota bacterium]
MSSAERYRESGVDLDAADRTKRRIASAVASTRTELSKGVVGGFGGMVSLPAGLVDPLLVMSTDGIGTKVLVAIQASRNDTVGEDLVNHCVNDVLVHGASALAFQDYIAGNDIGEQVTTDLVAGIARGCKAHAMVLTGGETAQLPDLYQSGHYDLAGTIIGVVSEQQAIHGDRIAPGDQLVAYASSGLHTNGYTLARRVLLEEMRLELDAPFPESGDTVAEQLLQIHRSYAAVISPLLGKINGLAHITGGGIEGNLSRVLPEGCGAIIDRASWEVPNVFRVLEEGGLIVSSEMFRVFNMGVGMIAVATAAVVPELVSSAAPGDAWVVGEVVSGEGVSIA